jgi:hypothetical protein
MRLERLAKDKHSSFLQKSINYCCKKFYRIGPWIDGKIDIWTNRQFGQRRMEEQDDRRTEVYRHERTEIQKDNETEIH